ncbi:MAG: pentapeptide repeat-containing protein [Pseudonocardiaceae bacterium]
MWLIGANFAGANLRGAQLTGVRMIGGDLTRARLSGSLWHRAALLGVSGLDSVIGAPELAVAAITGRDPADVMIAPTGDVSSVAFSPDGSLLATTSTDGTARLWDPATGAARATLFALEAGGYGVLLPDGSYKLEGNPGRSLWWAIKLCRFAPGELDAHVPAIRRLPADAPLSR